MVEDATGLKFLILRQGGVEVDQEITFVVALGFDETLFPLGGVTFWEELCQFTAQLVHTLVEGGIVDDGGVNADLEDRYVGGQQAAVAGEYVASRGLERVKTGLHLFSEGTQLVAFLGLH